uniref:PWWP domain-containing protein n=1 Tax=Branchiostoma floridae TaxID=7739 RepID=C3XWU0_BRAFL|eukprot:XP_002611190.1 hypothetical protein BRAFLDRAFT_88411 [Branchiostoma floridae]
MSTILSKLFHSQIAQELTKIPTGYIQGKTGPSPEIFPASPVVNMAAQFNIGDIVWAKLSSFPPWPSKIVRPKKDVKKPKGKKPVYFVFFYGTEDHAWVKAENLKPFEEYKDQMIKSNKGKRFHQAVEAVEKVLRKGGGAKRGRPPKHAAASKSGAYRMYSVCKITVYFYEPYQDTDDIDHEEVVPSSKPVQKTYSREPLLGKTVSLGAEASIILKRPREDNESDLYNFDESECSSQHSFRENL